VIFKYFGKILEASGFCKEAKAPRIDVQHTPLLEGGYRISDVAMLVCFITLVATINRELALNNTKKNYKGDEPLNLMDTKTVSLLFLSFDEFHNWLVA